MVPVLLPAQFQRAFDNQRTWIHSSAPALWASLPVAKKTRLQTAIFPEGLARDGSSYQIPVTSQAFAACAELAATNGEWRPREDSNLWHTV